MESLTLGDLALLSEEKALRRGADAQNLVHARRIVAFAIFPVLGEIIFSSVARRATRVDLVVALANLVFILLCAGISDAATGRSRLGKYFEPAAAVVKRHIRPWILGFVAAQYFLFMLFGNRTGWMPWAFCFPLVVLGFRFAPSEFVLLHGFFFATAVVEGLLVRGGRPGAELQGVLTGSGFANACVLVVVLFWTRSFRRQFIAQWNVEHYNAVDRARMRDELHYARDVQLSMLPEAPPAIDWLDIAAVSLPATEVGGDYFDYFRVSEHRLAIVCGDVAGHGLASGIVLAALRAGFTLLRDSLDDPALVLRRLDELVSETSRRRMLVSLAILLLDEERGVATIASAGHPPLIFRRRDGSTEAIEMFAPPLGVKLRQVLTTREVPFQQGDAFILHTDGIYEATDSRDDAYGFDRLLHVASITSGDASALRDAIVADVATFRGTAPQADDITVVVARVTR